MSTTDCKTCRRVGQKLFLKGEKCLSPKCPLTRKHYPPGRRAKRPRPISEYGRQLKEKQKLKFLYGLREEQFANNVKKATRSGGENIGQCLIELLESRLDNVVFRLGFAKSRSAGRQIVGHGHVLVNGRKVTIPSFLVKKGDKVSVRPQSFSKKVFVDLDIWLKKNEPPSWLKLDKQKRTGEVGKKPDKAEMDVDLSSIVEFYSR